MIKIKAAKRQLDTSIKLFMTIAVELAMLTLSSCAGHNPIEPPIPHAEVGYSGSQKTMAAIAAFAGVFGPIAVMKENDSRVQMQVRVMWDCHRWGQFVERVVTGYREGRSRDDTLKLVHELNATYHCGNCGHGRIRIKLVNAVYDDPDSLLSSPVENGKIMEAWCNENVPTN